MIDGGHRTDIVIETIRAAARNDEGTVDISEDAVGKRLPIRNAAGNFAPTCSE